MNFADYHACRTELLKDEFLSVPVRHITTVLREQKTLFKSYGVLEEQTARHQQISTPFSKIGRSRNKRGTELILIEQGSQLPKELRAAKRKQEVEASRLKSPNPQAYLYHFGLRMAWCHVIGTFVDANADSKTPQS